MFEAPTPFFPALPNISFSTLGYYIKYGSPNDCSEGGLAWL